MANEIKLQGARELKKIMEAVGPAIAKRAGVVGVRKGAMIMRKELKSASPRISGRLAKQWRYKKLRSRKTDRYVGYVVNLRAYHYYETLEFFSKRGKPLHPFAERTIDGAKQQALATMMAGTRTALAVEAGKSYARSKRAR